MSAKKRNEQKDFLIILILLVALAIVYVSIFMGTGITTQPNSCEDGDCYAVGYEYGYKAAMKDGEAYAEQAFKDGMDISTPEYQKILYSYFDANHLKYVPKQYDCTNMSYELAKQFNETNIVKIVYGKMEVNNTWGGHAWISIQIIIDPTNSNDPIPKETYIRKYNPIKYYDNFEQFKKEVS